jgi:hypothetical protein
MAYNSSWDEWSNLHLLLDERVSGFLRRVKNFVMGGYDLSDPALGLVVQVGQLGLNLAYCNGYELKQTNAFFAALADNTTNYVYVGFTKTVDPGGGYSAITVAIMVNQTGIDPADSIRLGEVDTAGGVITAIREVDNRYHIHSSQMDDDIEGNRNSIRRLTIQAGAAFPAVPVPLAGEMYFRTDLLQLYVFDGVVWQPLTPGAPPGTVVFTASPVGPPILQGEMVYLFPGLPNAVTQAIALAMATAEVVGSAMAPFTPPGFPGPFMTWHGTTGTAFVENLGPMPALVPGQKVWLSKFVPGSVTTLAPPNPCARKVLGVITDPTPYIFPVNPYVTVIWSPEPTIWVP